MTNGYVRVSLLFLSFIFLIFSFFLTKNDFFSFHHVIHESVDLIGLRDSSVTDLFEIDTCPFKPTFHRWIRCVASVFPLSSDIQV